MKPDRETMHGWTETPDAVALHLKQYLQPVEGEGGVIFPPTYAGKGSAGSGYNISTLSDTMKIATLDSVGSQANRMEPVFKTGKAGGHLVPQIEVSLTGKDGKQESVSLLDAGHRLGDALVRASELRSDAEKAFRTFLDEDNAWDLAKLSPTSLVFGVWDSRDTQAKLSRVVQSTIRASDIVELTRSAQYNPPTNYASFDVFTDQEKEKAEGSATSTLAQRGYVHVPATDMPGGIIARGPIVRDVTINLIALRRLAADNDENTRKLRHYILGIALVAATYPQDGFLRSGCLLVPDSEKHALWRLVHRDGHREDIELDHELALQYAEKVADVFGIGGNSSVKFDKKLAQEDIKKQKSNK